MSGQRRIVGVAAVVIGLLLLVSPFALDYPAKTQGVDDLTGSFRTTFSDDGLARVRADMDTVNAFVAQFEQEAAPAIAQALTDAGAIEGLDQFGPFVADNFPAVATGLGQFDEPILPYFNSIVDGLEANQHDFERADAIPTSWLPARSVTWIIVLLGVVAIVLGVWCLRSDARSARWAVPVFGVLIVLVALVLQVPAKSASVDNLTDDFRAAFSADGAALMRERFEIIRATSDELQGAMVPALAQALEMSPDELGAFLAGQFPDVAAGLGGLDGIVDRFDALVANVEANGEAFSRADSIPTASRATAWFPWHLLAPGILLAVVGGLGLVLGRRPTPAASGPMAATATSEPA